MDLKGKAKEVTGTATGDDKLKREGQAEQAVDKLKETASAVTDRVKNAIKREQ